MGQITGWLAERMGDAAVLMESPFTTEAVLRYMADPRPVAAEPILTRFRSLQAYYHYRDVLLVDPGGQVRLSLTDYRGPLREEAMKALSIAFHSRKAVLADLHAGGGELPPHLDIVAPFLAGDGQTRRPVAAAVLQCDARQFLYPLTQSWPTLSRSAETLLVRRDGDDVLFLNDLRHQQDAAFKLRFPLSQKDLPAAMAVTGREGVFIGKDYRGVDVLSVLKPVPGSPWFMVAKVDAAEAYADWRFRSTLILALIFVLLGASTAAVGAVWQRNGKVHYKALFEAEAARRKSEERHRITLMSVGDGVIATDAQGRVELLNPVAEALTGWTQKEARGKPLDEVFRIVHEETHQPVEDPVRRVVREGLVVGLANHTVLIARNGREHPIADSGAPIHDENGILTGVVLVFRDQTEERAAQKALQERERFFASTLDDMVTFLSVLKPDGEIVFVNNTPLKLVGKSLEDVRGMKFSDVDWWTYSDQTQELIKGDLERCASGQNIRREIQVHTLGGNIWIDFSMHPVLGEDGNVQYLIPEGRDITERKRAEEALRQSEERFRTVFERTTAGYSLTSPDGRLLKVNSAFAAMLGYTVEDVSRLSFLDITHAEDLPESRECVRCLLAGERDTCRFEKRYIHKDGHIVWTIVNTTLVRDKHDTPAFFVTNIQDITDRKRAEEEREKLQAQLIQAQKMEAVGRLAGGVAHDFNNMLNVIMGNAETAMMHIDAAGPLHHELQEILKAASRSADLTRQLLAFARKQTVSPKVLDLNDTVSGMLKMLRRLIGEDIDLAWMPGHDLGNVKIDPSQIDQVLANLLVNARDAIAGVGKITIETDNVVLDEAYCADHAGVVPGEYVLLAVSDSGCGMDKETASHLFGPFFTTKDVGKGTGLGLATVYGIVKQNDGFINVYSEPGHGSTFKIYLPRFKGEAVAAPAETEETTPQTGTETVLMVEDEEAILNIGERMLRMLGYRVLTAGTPAEAIQLTEERAEAIHLVITDVVMPEMNGRDLAERLRSIKPGMKCLYMSGYTANVIAHHGVLEEGVCFVQKPFSMKTLARKVREALGESKE